MNSFSVHSVKKYILSILVSVLVTVILLAIISIVFAFFPPASWLMSAIIGYSYILPAFISAFLSARASSGRGLLTGVITACLCLLAISLSPGIFLKRIPLGLLMGAIGGITGINSK